MRLPLQGDVSIDLIARILFVALLINFIGPALSFVISFFRIVPLLWLITLLDWFTIIVPFITFALFYLALRALRPNNKGETSRLLMLQAVIALPIFVMWFERNVIHASGYLSPLLNFAIQATYIGLIDILYLLFFTMLWKITKKQSLLKLTPRSQDFYLWTNLMFLLFFALHSINSIDLVYYFHYYMPTQLNWLFGYAPTILISLTCLAGWALTLKNAKREVVSWLKNFTLVITPAVFAALAETFRPLIGFIIISMIVWGASYEIFSPAVISLPLVLSAFGSFISFVILLSTQARTRNRNMIRLSLASAALAGISLSPASVLGVLTSLYILLIALTPISREAPEQQSSLS